MRLVYPRYFTVQDSTGDFDWIVLRMAMEKTATKFGPFAIGPSREALSVARLL